MKPAWSCLSRSTDGSQHRFRRIESRNRWCRVAGNGAAPCCGFENRWVREIDIRADGRTCLRMPGYSGRPGSLIQPGSRPLTWCIGDAASALLSCF